MERKIPKWLRKQIPDIEQKLRLMNENRCTNCKKKLENAVDSITGEKSKYLWQCKKCFPNLILSKG